MTKHKDVSAEDSSDWTQLLQTRISPRAEEELDRRLSENNLNRPSRAAWLREVVYRELGLVEIKA